MGWAIAELLIVANISAGDVFNKAPTHDALCRRECEQNGHESKGFLLSFTFNSTIMMVVYLVLNDVIHVSCTNIMARICE